MYLGMFYRQELIEHYEDLARDATNREAHAHWKIARAGLDEARRQFLAEDLDHWKATDDTSPDTNVTPSESAEVSSEKEVSVEIESIDMTVSNNPNVELTGDGYVDSYKPVGIIPGVFDKEETPVSLEEALHTIGFDTTIEGADFVQPAQHTDTAGIPEVALLFPSDDGVKEVYGSETVLNDPVELPLDSDNQHLGITHHTVSLDGRVELSTRSHQTVATMQELYGTNSDCVTKSGSRACEPPSVVQDIIYAQHSMDAPGPSSRGQASPSVAQDIIYAQSRVSPGSLISSSRGQAPPSIVGEIIYGTEENDMKEIGDQISLSERSKAASDVDGSQDGIESGHQTDNTPTPSTITTREEEDSSDGILSLHVMSSRGVSGGVHDRFISTRGHEPSSVVQEIIYKQDSQAEVFRTTRGHAPESTIQRLMYPGIHFQKSKESTWSPGEKHTICLFITFIIVCYYLY